MRSKEEVIKELREIDTLCFSKIRQRDQLVEQIDHLESKLSSIDDEIDSYKREREPLLEELFRIEGLL